MPWNPSQYLKFADERLRPGLDLLGRVGDLPAGDVYDLGCGTGAHARAIAERWPDRAVIGIDASPEMLEKAAATTSSVRWMEGRVESWRPPAPAALVFSNAVLHWADGHAELFPRLAQAVAPGGVLAVQMPRSFSQPSHVLMRRTAQEGPWAARLAPLLRQDPVAGPETYYDLLAPLAVGGIDIWET
jgi:trans-aconitate 2-methyltransferase